MEDDFSEFNDIKGRIFFNKYHCLYRVGKGTFGCVYKAQYNQENYAIKFESKKKNDNLLEKEAFIMKYLQGTNIPEIEMYSSTNEYNILVMEFLGKSLIYYLKKFKYFSVKTVCMLGEQILSILEYIHDHHIVHRDIKPDNFCMGLNNYKSKYVYIIDFGLAKKYRSSVSLIHNPLINKRRLIGTPRYASINALKGYEQSRRDDLESLGYVLIYFLKGELPWQNLNAKTKEERNRKILEKKMEISSSKLCEGLPIEFEKFLNYVKNLEYTQTPNYEMLRNFLMNIMKNHNLKYNHDYDWTTKEELNIRQISDCFAKENKLIKKGAYDYTPRIYHLDYNKNKYVVNDKKCEMKNHYNNNKLTNIYQSNDFLPIVYDERNNNNEEVINCSSACNIF